jgi:hypothetical protein
VGLVRRGDGEDIDGVGGVFAVRRRNTDSCIRCIYVRLGSEGHLERPRNTPARRSIVHSATNTPIRVVGNWLMKDVVLWPPCGSGTEMCGFVVSASSTSTVCHRTQERRLLRSPRHHRRQQSSDQRGRQRLILYIYVSEVRWPGFLSRSF